MESLIIKPFIRNPLVIWMAWFVRSRIISIKNLKKNLKIGYMSHVENVSFGNYNTIYNNVSLINSKLGDYVYISDGSKLNSVTLGNFCSIGPNVKIGLGMHPTNFLSTFPAFFSTHKQCQVTFAKKNYFEEQGPILIGNDVWIGANVLVMDNIKIGDGAIIAAGAVVSKDVPPFSIVGGVPAKVIKYRFSEDKIKEITDLKWWDKNTSWLTENAYMFQNEL